MILCKLAALCAILGWNQNAPIDERIALEPAPESAQAQEALADPKAPRSVAIYDLEDLALPPGFDERFRELAPDARRYREELGAERLALMERAIRRHVRPKFQRGLDELQVHHQSVFVVTATAEQHAWIRQFLGLQRREDAPYLNFDTKQLRAERSALEAIGLEGPTEVIADKARADALSASFDATGFEVLSAPRLRIGSGSHAYMDVFNEVAYVKSYEVVYVHPGPQAIADPVIDVVREGTHCDLAGIEIEPGLYALDFEFERTEIQRPIPTKEIQVTIDAPPVTISQPTVLTSSLSSTVLLRDGAGVWFRVPDGERELLLMVQLTLVPAPTADSGALEDLPECPVEVEHAPAEERELPPGQQRAREVPR